MSENLELINLRETCKRLTNDNQELLTRLDMAARENYDLRTSKYTVSKVIQIGDEHNTVLMITDVHTTPDGFVVEVSQ